MIRGSLSKPPPSASRPPHRTSASICDEDTCTETRRPKTLKAIPVETVAFNAKCNYESALYCRQAVRSAHTVWAHSARFSLTLFPKMEGKRDKATVSLTVAVAG